MHESCRMIPHGKSPVIKKKNTHMSDYTQIDKLCHFIECNIIFKKFIAKRNEDHGSNMILIWLLKDSIAPKSETIIVKMTENISQGVKSMCTFGSPDLLLKYPYSYP